MAGEHPIWSCGSCFGERNATILMHLELDDKEKELLKRLCSLPEKKEDLLVFLKDEFFVDTLLLVDDEEEVVYYYYPNYADEDAEILKLQKLFQIIKFLRDNGYITLVPYSHKNKNGPSIIWLRSTTNFSYNPDKSIQISKAVKLGNGYVEEKGKKVMRGIKLGTEFYDDVQLAYSRMTVNPSMKEFVDNKFKTREEIKTFNEKTGSLFWKAIRAIKNFVCGKI